MFELAAASHLIASPPGSLSNKEPIIQHIHARVIDTIESSKKFPDWNSKELEELKPGLEKYFNELVEKSVLEVMGTDKAIRPYFVGLQAYIEQVLAEELGKKNIDSLEGIIYTPMPATPLCTPKDGGVSSSLVDPAIMEDSLRLFTVKTRPAIVRDFLDQGGHLYIVYPKSGFMKRNDKEQGIYTAELEHYQTRLFDRPLDRESMDNQFVGAVYLFKKDGKSFAFAIQATQARNVENPQNAENQEKVCSFALWFGDLKIKAIADRVSSVLNDIRKDKDSNVDIPSI